MKFARGGKARLIGGRELLVPVDVAGEELLLPSADGVSESLRALTVSLCNPEADGVLERLMAETEASEGCVGASESCSSSSSMVSSFDSCSVSPSSSSWDESGL